MVNKNDVFYDESSDDQVFESTSNAPEQTTSTEQPAQQISLKAIPKYLKAIFIVLFFASMILWFFKVVSIIVPLLLIGAIVFITIKYDFWNMIKNNIAIIKTKRDDKLFIKSVIFVILYFFVIFMSLIILALGIYRTVYLSSPNLLARDAVIADIKTDTSARYNNYEYYMSNVKSTKTSENDVFEMNGKIYFYSCNYSTLLKECYFVEINDTVRWSSDTFEYISKNHSEHRESSNDIQIKPVEDVISTSTAIAKADEAIKKKYTAEANYHRTDATAYASYNDDGSIRIRVIVTYTHDIINNRRITSTNTVTILYSNNEYTVLYIS